MICAVADLVAGDVHGDFFRAFAQFHLVLSEVTFKFLGDLEPFGVPSCAMTR